MSNENKEPMSAQTDWTQPDKDGNFQIPDYLYPLVNKVGMQFYFVEYSGLSTNKAVLNILWCFEKFLKQQTADLRKDLEFEKSNSEKMRKALRFPNKSEWINEFKENWYKENSGVLSNRVTDNLWKETERTVDMIYKYQRKSFEEALKQYDAEGGGDEK